MIIVVVRESVSFKMLRKLQCKYFLNYKEKDVNSPIFFVNLILGLAVILVLCQFHEIFGQEDYTNQPR